MFSHHFHLSSLFYYNKVTNVSLRLSGYFTFSSLSTASRPLFNACSFTLKTSVFQITMTLSSTGMRILVMLLLDTLPMLGNVLLLCFFVFFIFGIIGVQLWAGLLRQRCYIPTEMVPKIRNSQYYDYQINSYHYRDDTSEKEFICSAEESSGMHKCSKLPNFVESDGRTCSGRYNYG